MTNSLRIAVLTLLCCALPTLAVPAFSSSFNIRHDNAYVYMPLPGTLGESVTFEWSPIVGWRVELFGLPGVEDGADVAMFGIVQLGPLLSLDAEWNPDGSIGDAEYIFGKGKFELELAFNLLDGTPHTMTIRGKIGPLYVSVQDSYPNRYAATSDNITMSLLQAKLDPKSAALFGMKSQISGSTYYYTDVYNMTSPNRELALFGSVYFDATPVRHFNSARLNAVPEPGILSLIGLGVAAAIRRRRA